MLLALKRFFCFYNPSTKGILYGRAEKSKKSFLHAMFYILLDYLFIEEKNRRTGHRVMSKELVERIRNHDRQAMSELYLQYAGVFTSICYRYILAEDDAKDVLQDSFIKIFTALPTFEYRDEPSFRSWMVRIVVNQALHFLRDRKRLNFTELTPELLETRNEEEPPLEYVTADELHQLICELPDGYRTVLNLYVFEEYSHRKIAELLNIKEVTSASQLYHAKQLLAKRIKELIHKKHERGLD